MTDQSCTSQVYQCEITALEKKRRRTAERKQRHISYKYPIQEDYLLSVSTKKKEYYRAY